MTILYLLLIFMILGSIVAIETRNLISSVISVGVVGYALSIVFLILEAPEVAITQVVVEILVLVILIRTTISIDNTAIESHRDTFAVVSSLVFFGLFLVFASYAFLEMPKFGEPLMRVSQKYLESGVTDTGVNNIVTAVALDYRALDAFGEITVIFVSVVGAAVLLRKTGPKKIKKTETSSSPNGE